MGSVIPDPTADLRWNDYRGAIHEIFHENARRHPERECVVETRSPRTPQRNFTYRQISEAANVFSHYLIANGCKVGDVITIYAYRGVELVVGYMGGLAAGATINVLDPQYPPDRQKVLLEVANPRFLIHIQRATEEAGKLSESVNEFVKDNLEIKAEVPALILRDDGLLEGGSADGDSVDVFQAYQSKKGVLPDVLIGPDDNPTLSFTSGSEGKPKGVLGRHFSLTYYFPWMSQRFGLSDRDRFSMLSGIAHDPIQRDIFTPLFLGASLYVPPRDYIGHEVLAEWYKEFSISVTHLTPAMLQVLVGGSTSIFPKLHHAFLVGDLLTKKDCKRLQELAPNVFIENMYGTTETQRAVSFFEVPSRAQDPDFLDQLPDVIPVGQGMLNVQLLVVDREDRNKLCAVGEQGELFLRAGGLSEGYLGNDEATQKLNQSKFLSNWFVEPTRWTAEYEELSTKAPQPWMSHYKGPRDRVYRTGDLGRFRPDGSVECTGRVDNQVKLRGFRIELGEIDAHLSKHPFVRENVTLLRRNEGEEPTLVSYIVPETKRWFEHLAADGVNGETHQVLDESLAGLLRKFKSLSDNCKDFLKSKVPHYAVPEMVLPLLRMPLNPNGKIDRANLPFPTATDLAFLHRRASRTSSALAKMTETQKQLAAIWAELLPNHTARMFVPESNFFEEGGHSIRAQRMLFEVRKQWKGIDIPMSAIFQYQTLEQFAAEIDRSQEPLGQRLDAGALGNNSATLLQDEAYGEDANDLASHLPQSIRSAGELKQNATVFLTGATGFLGIYILSQIIQKGLRVITLSRSSDPAAGLARIESIAKAYSLWTEEWRQIEVVKGDISQIKLGLSDLDWNRIAEEADIIISNAALVNWMLPYASLRRANVLSTIECIDLCTSGKPKRFAFVSSTSDLDSEHYVQLSKDSVAAGGPGVLESDDLEGSRKGLATGYGQSKWASEFIIREAGRRGLTGAIIRPGYIVGDPRSGTSITDDFVIRLWKGSLQVGARPDISNTLNAVPVTQVSKIVVASALHPPTSPLGVVHITGHPRLTINSWIGALEKYGYVVPQVPYEEWSSKLKEYVADDTKEEHALLPLFHFVTINLPADAFAPELDDRNAATALKAVGGDLKDSVITLEAIGAYLSYLVAIGFLPPPTKTGERALPKLELSKEQLEGLASVGGRGGK